MARNEFFPAQLIFILFTGYKFLNVCLSRLFGSFTNIYLRQMCLAHLRFSNPVNNARKLKQQSYSWPHHLVLSWLSPYTTSHPPCFFVKSQSWSTWWRRTGYILLELTKKCCNPPSPSSSYHNCISYDWAFQVRTQWVKLQAECSLHTSHNVSAIFSGFSFFNDLHYF